MTVEEAIRDFCRRGFSRRAAANALGICNSTMRAYLDSMEPLPWPAHGQSVDEKRRYAADRFDTPERAASRAKAIATLVDSHRVILDGVRATVPEHMKRYGVTIARSTVYRRVKAGMELRDAILTPPRRR